MHSMARISEQSIEKVRQAADIIEVVSSHVELKQRGRNFFGLCPFHSEKTPSFSVNPEKQIYKCFGCGTGGGVINFIMEIETLNFVDAIEKLAQKYNIKIESTKADIRSRNLKDQLIKKLFIKFMESLTMVYLLKIFPFFMKTIFKINHSSIPRATLMYPVTTTTNAITNRIRLSENKHRKICLPLRL